MFLCSCFVLFCFSSEAYGIEAFIAPQRRTYLRKTDFYTQRVDDRKINSQSRNINALQVPPISSLAISLVCLLEWNHTDRKEQKWFIWAEEQSHHRRYLYRINHSYQRERDSAHWTET